MLDKIKDNWCEYCGTPKHLCVSCELNTPSNWTPKTEVSVAHREGEVRKCPTCHSLNITESNDPLFDWKCNHCGRYWFEDAGVTLNKEGSNVY